MTKLWTHMPRTDAADRSSRAGRAIRAAAELSRRDAEPLPRSGSTAVPRPNLFIVGGLRSGTTTVYEYLRTHPSIFMAHPKEPNFWCDDFPAVQRRSDVLLSSLDDYLALFAAATPAHRFVG